MAVYYTVLLYYYWYRYCCLKLFWNCTAEHNCLRSLDRTILLWLKQLTVEMQESLWPANCPESLYDICLEYCVLNLDNTVYRKSTDGQLLLKSEIFLPLSVCDTLLSHLHPVSRKYLPLFASPAAINFRHINLKSVTDLTDDELQNVLAHRPTDLRISSARLTEDSLNLISAESHNLQTLHIVKCENIFFQRSRSRRHSWKEKFRKNPTKKGTDHRLQCPKARYVVLRGGQFGVGKNLCDILSDLKLLTRLDLSESSISVQDLHDALAQLQKLQILSLHSVELKPSLRDAFEAIAQVKSLRFVIVTWYSSCCSSFYCSIYFYCHHLV